jgi:hypothetical protein
MGFSKSPWCAFSPFALAVVDLSVSQYGWLSLVLYQVSYQALLVLFLALRGSQT